MLRVERPLKFLGCKMRVQRVSVGHATSADATRVTAHTFAEHGSHILGVQRLCDANQPLCQQNLLPAYLVMYLPHAADLDGRWPRRGRTSSAHPG